MVSIPQFSDPQNQAQPQALANVSVPTSAPAEAFGAGQSNQTLDTAMEGVAKSFSDVAREQRDKADQVAHVQADTQASQLQTQIQVKVSQMKGQDAFAAPDYAEQTWNDGIAKIRSNLNGPNQQLSFDKTSSSRYQDLNRSVQMHVSDQAAAFDDQTTQSGIDQARTAAVVNAGDNKAVDQNLDVTKQLVDGWAQRKGVPTDSDIYKNKLTSEVSATHRDVIQAKLEAGLDDDAKQYFADHKDQMAAGDVLHASSALENSEVISQGNDLWSDLQGQKGMKFTDGSLDVEKMRDYVMDNTDMSDQRKEKVWSFIKARGREYNVDRNRTMAETERTFTNGVITARQNGEPMDQAMLLVGKYGTDQYDQQMKTQAVQAMYAPPSKSDPQTQMSLWEGVRGGTVNKDQIDSAFNNNKINVADWKSLREDYYKQQTDGEDPQTKSMNDRVKLLAAQNFGDQDDRAAFLYEVHSASQGKSPDEAWKIANDKLKGDPSTGIFGMFQSKQYKSDLQRDDSNNLAWGATYDAIGKKQALAIGQAVLSTGKPSWGLGDVNNYANEFGGADQLKVGTPVNNAITSLSAAGKRATPANVKFLLQNYPDGNAPPGVFK